MMRPRYRAILWSLGLAVLLAGAVHAVGVLRFRNRVAARMARKRGELRELQALAAEAEYIHRIRRAFERSHDASLDPLRRSVAALFGEKAAGSIRFAEDPLPEGWGAQRADMTMQDVPLAKVAELIVELETRVPPWRLAHCDVVARQKEGTATVSLRFRRIAQASGSGLPD